jgi:hypothetical protein
MRSFLGIRFGHRAIRITRSLRRRLCFAASGYLSESKSGAMIPYQDVFAECAVVKKDGRMAV